MLHELSKDQIETMLADNKLGRVGCHAEGRTYVTPVNYVYDGKSIIAHSVDGMKIRMMRANPQVCFQVEEVKDFSNWKSVIVWGEFQEITDTAERSRAMQFFVDHTLTLKVKRTGVVGKNVEVHQHPIGNLKPVIYRIIIFEKTGRYEDN